MASLWGERRCNPETSPIGAGSDVRKSGGAGVECRDRGTECTGTPVPTRTGGTCSCTPQVVYKTGASSSSPASPTPGKFVPTCLIVAVVRDILSRRAGLTITSVSQEGTPPASMQVRTGQSKSKPVGRMGESEESDKDDEQGLQALYHLRTRVAATTPPITVQVKLDMEVDTGASLSLMSESTYKRICPGRMLEPSHVQLQTYLLSQWWVVLV